MVELRIGHWPSCGFITEAIHQKLETHISKLLMSIRFEMGTMTTSQEEMTVRTPAGRVPKEAATLPQRETQPPNPTPGITLFSWAFLGTWAWVSKETESLPSQVPAGGLGFLEVI